MNAGPQAQKKTATPQSIKAVHSGLIQRKCACGASAGFSGDCEGCQETKLSSKPVGIQTKLTISQPGDAYEQEADRVADAVVGGTASSSQRLKPRVGALAVQRQERSKPQLDKARDDEIARKAEEVLVTIDVVKSIKDGATELGEDFVATLPGKIIVGTAAASAVAGLAATNIELPAQLPEIPLDAVIPGLTAKLTYEGPAQSPTEASISFIYVPPASSTKKKPGMSESEKFRAETARMAADQAKFREGLKTPEERTEDAAMTDAYWRMKASDPLNLLNIPGLKPKKDNEPLVPKEKEDKPLMLKEANTGQVPTSLPSHVHDVLSSPGQPLDAATRAFMEPRFGHDFSDVRVHSGSLAAQSAREVNANAYTVGHDLVFGAGQFAPETHDGKRLIAHELTHVAQAPDASGAVILRDADPLVQQTMTPEAVSRLSNEDIDLRIQAVLDQLRTLKDGTPEQQTARANLTHLEEEVNSRDYHSPVLVREGLIGAVGELLGKFAAVEQHLAALFAPGLRSQGAIEIFKKRFGANGLNQAQWIRAALEDAGQRALTAPKDDPNAAFEAFGAAGTRLVAATFGAQLLGVWTAFLQLSDVVLRQVPSYSVEHLLVLIDKLWPRFDRPFAELSSLEAARVQGAVITLPALLDQLVAEHTSLITDIETSGKNAQKIMLAAALVEALTAVASLRISLPPRTPGPPLVGVRLMAGGVTSTGALVGGRLVISVEWVEMIRRLVAAGVISVPVVAAGIRAGVMMATAGPPGQGGAQTAADVVSSGTTPLTPGKSPLGQYGMDKYGTFANRPIDKLAGHELLQNLWLEVKGFGKRLAGPASRENPAVALTHAEHVEVGRQQRSIGLYDRKKLAQMSAVENIELNALAMKKAGIPDFVIETLKKDALQHATTLKFPTGGAVP